MEAGGRQKEVGSRRQTEGGWKQEADRRKWEAGGRQKEVRSRRQETGGVTFGGSLSPSSLSKVATSIFLLFSHCTRFAFLLKSSEIFSAFGLPPEAGVVVGVATEVRVTEKVIRSRSREVSVTRLLSNI